MAIKKIEKSGFDPKSFMAFNFSGSAKGSDDFHAQLSMSDGSGIVSLYASEYSNNLKFAKQLQQALNSFVETVEAATKLPKSPVAPHDYIWQRKPVAVKAKPVKAPAVKKAKATTK